MKISDSDHIKRLDQAIGPVPTPDPVKVQGEVHAYLVQRGHDVARDLDLPQASDEDLAQLGRLDCIDQNPGLHPDLATHLEMIASERERPSTWAQDVARYQGHPHARNETCTVDQVDDPRPNPDITPDRTTTFRSDISGMGSGDRSDQGVGRSAARAVPKNGSGKRNEPDTGS